jgi:hypothetical protein
VKTFECGMSLSDIGRHGWRRRKEVFETKGSKIWSRMCSECLHVFFVLVCTFQCFLVVVCVFQCFQIVFRRFLERFDVSNDFLDVFQCSSSKYKNRLNRTSIDKFEFIYFSSFSSGKMTCFLCHPQKSRSPLLREINTLDSRPTFSKLDHYGNVLTLICFPSFPPKWLNQRLTRHPFPNGLSKLHLFGFQLIFSTWRNFFLFHPSLSSNANQVAHKNMSNLILSCHL